MEHAFTPSIRAVLATEFKENAADIFALSPLIQYLNIKTKSASKGAKARSSFANLYALYVLIEDYLKGGFAVSNKYSDYDGARFADLFARQRQLPFGSKLQNHALNSRMNDEFKGLFPTVDIQPIIRNVETNRYWINENVLLITVGKKTFNIAEAIIKIIEAYIDAKKASFNAFMDDCEKIEKLQGEPQKVRQFVEEMIRPNVDARIFEIVSFAILKAFYGDQIIYWGWSREELKEEVLILYKTGRTNANDGGIDFVMRPLGRFFQVTETLDVKKYFLDIDKIQRFPLTFVIKSQESAKALRSMLEEQASKQYKVKQIVQKYMDCIEEIINIPVLLERFNEAVQRGALPQIISEIVTQSRVEFNMDKESETGIDIDAAEEAVEEA